MTMDYTELYSELLVMKQELESHLLNRTDTHTEEFGSEPLFQHTKDEKKLLIQKHIQDDLYDVNRALMKLEFGIYGICEETGERIPLEKLKTIPTARTINDFRYNDLVKI